MGKENWEVVSSSYNEKMWKGELGNGWQGIVGETRLLHGMMFDYVAKASKLYLGLSESKCIIDIIVDMEGSFKDFFVVWS